MIQVDGLACPTRKEYKEADEETIRNYIQSLESQKEDLEDQIETIDGEIQTAETVLDRRKE